MLPESCMLRIGMLEDEPPLIPWPVDSPGSCCGFRVVTELEREECASFLASERESQAYIS
jgi:hypothetical protein